MQAPFPHARFIPTGGTSERDLDQWLALAQVCAVGGAWLAPPQEIRDGNWPMIRDRAQRVLKRLRDLGP
jgi:2-dehydro-3-deoxyphosphogluconate aldolase/(4S)-4-hydroxy-2-oxoglutarate aldolase